MSADLTDRLRRLGLGKGTEGLRPAAERRSAKRVEGLLPGRLIRHGESACFATEERYPPEDLHGRFALGALLDIPSDAAGRMVGQPALGSLPFDRFLFTDTETTGLSGGAGTLAFMVGIGFFEPEAFVVRQYFLRSPGDEPAMLADLAEQVDQRPGIVSFNGRSFDIPLLETRYILNRQPPFFQNDYHLDLLSPARRLWGSTLPSCRLIALEADVLEVQRDQADVPSGIIPMIYRDYLRTGNGIEMPRIFYHNKVDILSLVTLTTHLCLAFDQPDRWIQSGAERAALARWYEVLGMGKEAELSYRKALDGTLSQDLFPKVLLRLGRLLKRGERFDEAAVVWRQLAAVEMDQVVGHVELAKHHEWRAKDLGAAAEWTRQALALVARWPAGLQGLVRPELSHRLGRLERKQRRRQAEGG